MAVAPCGSPYVSPFRCTSSISAQGFNQAKLKKRMDVVFPLERILISEKCCFRGYVGFKFKLQCCCVALPAKSSTFNGKKRSYGGILPSVLRDLASQGDVEKTLSSCERLSPKELTVILKEQGSCERVVRVFEWMKLQKEYVPNVIHYNVVLRALGKARKWDELRLCWVDMAKNNVLPTNNTYGTLIDVYGRAGLVKEAVLWIKHMRLRGIYPDEVVMSTVVRVLKEAREYDRADRFYRDWCSGEIELEDLDLDSMMDFGNGTGPSSSLISLKHFLSTELFKTGGGRMTIANPTPATDFTARKPCLTATYNTLIDLYGKADRLKDAADVFSEMIRSGVAMDAITFNTMIHICGRHGHLSEAESLLSKMEDRGISPDTKTYNILMSLYANSGDVDASLRCYRKIRQAGLHPDAVTYRAILHILCERQMVLVAESVIEEMERFGTYIDEHSLPIVVKMYVSQGSLDKAKAIWEKFHLNGSMQSKTRAAVIDVYADRGLWNEAEAVFYWKQESAIVKRDVLEYNVMIKAYGRAQLYDKAFSLFKIMRNHGTWPDDCTYNSLIQMFSGGNLVDRARDLLAEMQEIGSNPKCLTFSALIASYSRLGQLSEAVSVYGEMEMSGVRPNEVVFGSLINGFADAGQAEEALCYFRKMENCGISANKIILTTLIKAYSKLGSLEGAKQIYEKIKSLPGGPDAVATNCMINAYAEFGMISEAESLFENMKEKGLADGVSFATMMHLYKSMGMLDEAIDVAEEMKLSGLLKNSASYNTVMGSYAANGQLSECGELLYEMTSRKISPDNETLKILFNALRKGGLASEAVAQLDSCYHDGKPYGLQAIITSVYAQVGLHKLALESCEALMKSEVGLDSAAYNVALHAYGASGRVDQALNVFMKMQDCGIEPDIATYVHLVGCYGKAGMLEGVKRIYSQMKYGEWEPNESLFNAIMNAYEEADRSDLADLVGQEMKFALDNEQSSEIEHLAETLNMT
ncbi:unnamed protein product [Rhodiola kirilowii]